MRLETLRVTNVRRVRDACLQPGPALNLLVGRNGSGKTSLLEAIQVLGSGRSFRTRRVVEVVTRGEESLSVYGTVTDASGRRTRIGIEKQGLATRLRIDGQDVRTASSLARLLPIVFIGPDCTHLLTGGSELRRRLVDWLVFHVEHEYLVAWQRYERVLRQRNMLLREQAPFRELEPWDEQLAAAGERVQALRSEHAAGFLAVVRAVIADLVPLPVAIDLEPGWDAGKPLLAVLRESREQDCRLGYTRAGPHRADLRVRTSGMAARAVLSRGESRLLAMGLHLSQGLYFRERRGEVPLVLVDDLGTELDQGSCRRFLDALERLAAQTFVTTVPESAAQGPAGGVGRAGVREERPAAGSRVFHVEQGAVQEVV